MRPDNNAHNLEAEHLDRFPAGPQGVEGRRRKLNLRRIVLVVFLICTGVSTFLLLDYFADMPRERGQKRFSYYQRVLYGLEMWQRMRLLQSQATEDPFPHTKLPVFELTLPTPAMENLFSDLPESGLAAQEGVAKFEGTEVSARAKVTGISVNHWGMPWKSWNVALKDGLFRDLTQLNFMIPRSDTQFENWLGNEMARRMGGILTPHSEFVHFRLNGELNGVRLLLEPVTAQFISRRGLPPGKLFHGDITTAQIYDGVPRPPLFSEVSAWRVDSLMPEDRSASEISVLVNIVRRIHNPYEFFEKLPRIMNVDALVRYMALLEIVCSVHIDETHNWKLYFNPETGQLEPIVWNPVAYYWQNTKWIDLAPNDLFRVVLSNPGFREDKDRALWQAIHGSLSEDSIVATLEAERDRISPDMHASYLKWAAGSSEIRLLSNDDWSSALTDLKEFVRERHAFLRLELRASDVRYRLSSRPNGGALIGIRVASRSGVKVDSLRLQLDQSKAGIPVTVERRGLEDLGKPVLEPSATMKGFSDENGVVTLSVGDTLSSKRRIKRRREIEIVPATYVYEISLPSGVTTTKVVGVSGKNSVSGEEVAIGLDDSIEIPEKHSRNIVWWDPRDFAHVQ